MTIDIYSYVANSHAMNKQDSIQNEDILTLCHGLCMCGCGTVIPLKDSCGRPKRFVLGHNKRRLKDSVSIEVSKIVSLDQARHIIYTQANVIREYERNMARLQDCAPQEQYTRYS